MDDNGIRRALEVCHFGDVKGNKGMRTCDHKIR
jgi:hypothetical protein